MFFRQIDNGRVDKLDPRAVNVISKYRKEDDTYVDVDYEWCKESDFQSFNLPASYTHGNVKTRICLKDP